MLQASAITICMTTKPHSTEIMIINTIASIIPNFLHLKLWTSLLHISLCRDLCSAQSIARVITDSIVALTHTASRGTAYHQTLSWHAGHDHSELTRTSDQYDHSTEVGNRNYLIGDRWAEAPWWREELESQDVVGCYWHAPPQYRNAHADRQSSDPVLAGWWSRRGCCPCRPWGREHWPLMCAEPGHSNHAWERKIERGGEREGWWRETSASVADAGPKGLMREGMQWQWERQWRQYWTISWCVGQEAAIRRHHIWQNTSYAHEFLRLSREGGSRPLHIQIFIRPSLPPTSSSSLHPGLHPQLRSEPTTALLRVLGIHRREFSTHFHPKFNFTEPSECWQRWMVTPESTS